MFVFLALLAWWLWLPALIGLVWCLSAWFWPGIGWQNAIEAWVYNSFLHGNVTWIWLLIWSLASLVIAFWLGSDASESSEKGAGAIFGIANTLLFVVSLVLLVAFNVNLDKYEANYYARSATIYVKDPASLPSSISRINGTAAYHDTPSPGDGCALLYRGGNNDSHGCIKQGDLPADSWVPRVGSHDTAIQAIKRSSGVSGGASLDEQTVVYLNGEKSGVWSGIVDGSGIGNPIAGVAEWSGEGIATMCDFKGPYALDRSFQGGKSNSLMNLFHERWPLLTFQQADIWGYCKPDGKTKNGQPLIVLPVTKPVPFSHRTVDAPAGVIVLRGDNGKTIMDYHPEVKAGEFPGPVYPASLAAKQRSEVNWVAGRQNQDSNHFGFEPTDDKDVQTENVSEFLLMDQKSGRLEYVTPLTLNNSTSQLFVAFSVMDADEVHPGQLNPLSVYVFNDDDNRRVPIANLVSAANNWLATNQPWLRSNGMQLKEFEPINGDTWRGYIENNNTQVQYTLDVTWDNQAQNVSKTVLIPASGVVPPPAATPGSNTPAPAPNAAPGQPPAPGNDAMCANPDRLSPQQLQQCITDMVNQLTMRVASGAPVQQPPAVATPPK